MTTISPVKIRPDDVPQTLVEGMYALPGFIPDSNGWEEQDYDQYPELGAAQYGAVGEVEVNVVKRRDGYVQLNFCLYHQAEEFDGSLVMSAVTWLLPSTLSAEQISATVSPALQFLATGYLQEILDNPLLLSIVNVANQVLDGLLFGQPKEFMDHPARCFRPSDSREPPIIDEVGSGNAFIREFIIQVGLAEPYFS